MSQNEARNEKLHRSFELIEDEFIVEASPQMAKPMVAIRKHIIKKVALIAACACLCVAAIPIFFLFGKYKPIEEPPQIPVYDDAQYSALDIARFISSKGNPMGTATTSYEKVYVSQDKELNIGTIPNEEYLTVYKIKEPQKELDEAEFSTFATNILSHWYEKRNVPMQTFEIINREKYSDPENKWLEASVNRKEDIHVLPIIAQRYYMNSATFAFEVWPIQGPFILGEAKVSMFDSTISDEQIIADLEPLKKELFYIFNVEFKDVTVNRRYVAGEKYPYSITVRFYNSTNEFDNSSDNMTIVFSHRSKRTDASLPYINIRYDQYRDDTTVPLKKVKMISLEKAEELLCKGYVFGGHSCPICMSEQSPVDFEEYDYVNLEYVRGYNEYSELIPFYAFYKYIGNDSGGNKVFAKTYVPAIEVSGYEEYFESQAKYHKQSTGTEYVEVE